jgi:glycine cleavage system regulatory protein
MVIPYTITNAGHGYQDLTTTTAVVASSGGNVTQGGVAVAGCLATWFTVVNSPPASVDLATNATATGSATITMQDSGTNQNPCEGVSPQVTINAS